MDKNLQRSPARLSHRAGQYASEIFDAHVDGLSPRQLVVLIAVDENEGKSQAALVERTGVDRSTLSELVMRLERKGLLQRHRTEEDTRANAVELTPVGRQLLKKVELLAKRVDETLLQALPKKQRAQFLVALQSVVTTLQKAQS